MSNNVFLRNVCSSTLVEFIESNSSAVIPINWFVNNEEDECYWPKKTWTANRTNKAVEERWEAGENGTNSKYAVLEKQVSCNLRLRLHETRYENQAK